MFRYINTCRVSAAQLATPAENPLLTDNNRLMDVWFDGQVVRKQLFKKVTKIEQESFRESLIKQGFIESGSLLINPDAVMFAEMESELVGGVITIGYGDNNKPVELKVNAKAFKALCDYLAR